LLSQFSLIALPYAIGRRSSPFPSSSIPGLLPGRLSGQELNESFDLIGLFYSFSSFLCVNRSPLYESFSLFDNEEPSIPNSLEGGAAFLFITLTSSSFLLIGWDKSLRFPRSFLISSVKEIYVNIFCSRPRRLCSPILLFSSY